MTTFGVFDPFNLPLDCTSIDAFLTDWDRQQHEAVGRRYVYAFRDAACSVFYIGKGQGDRAHDIDGHRHGRLGYYIAGFLGGIYTVDMLRSGLSPDDAEFLEFQLIEVFGQQLVNWAGNLGSVLTSEVVTQLQDLRPDVQAQRMRARAAAAGDRREEAVPSVREALAYLSSGNRPSTRRRSANWSGSPRPGSRHAWTFRGRELVTYHRPCPRVRGPQ